MRFLPTVFASLAVVLALHHSLQVDAFNIPGSTTIDFERVSEHLSELQSKYDRQARTLAAVQAQPKARSIAVQPQAHDGHGDTQQQVLFSRMWQDDQAPQQQMTARTSGKSGTVVLTTDSNYVWYGPITLGGQTVNAIEFDTGSSDLIVVQGNGYTPGVTAHKTDQTLRAPFGSGKVATGDVYLDHLEVGGLNADDVAVGLSNTSFFNRKVLQGIAGMAFDSISELKRPTFFESLMSAGALARNIFTFNYGVDRPTLTLGGIGEGVTGEPTWVNVDTSQGFWGTNGSMNGIAIRAIQDTGTTYIVAPVRIAAQLFAQLGLKSFMRNGILYGYVDDPNAPLPEVTIQFDGFARTLSSDTVSYYTTDDGKPVLTVIGRDFGYDFVTFGGAWFRNVVAVFSREDEQRPLVGFIGR